MPLGVWLQDWTSATLLEVLFKILVQDALGYNATFSGHSSAEETGMLAVAGCKDPVNRDQPNCQDYTAQRTHVLIEFWSVFSINAQWVQDNYPQQVPEYMGSVGYVGREGTYVRVAEQDAALNAVGAHLEYYGDHNASWHHSWEYFDGIGALPLAGLSPCNQTQAGNAAIVATVLLWTPDPGGLEVSPDGSVSARCPDGYWWLAPACRDEPSKCVPWVTGGEGWDLVSHMQRAIAFNMPWALATAATWDLYIEAPHRHRVLMYGWVPSEQFLDLRPLEVAFPPYNKTEHDLGNHRTAADNVPLEKYAYKYLHVFAPRAYDLLAKLSVSMDVMNTMLADFVRSGDAPDDVVCRWLQRNPTTWQAWLPKSDVTLCDPGKGLTALDGAFVTDRAVATGCNFCGTGNYSDGVNDTYVCRDCQAGRAQPSLGTLSCVACLQGESQSAAGRSACERCPKGTFANGTGSLVCDTCPVGTTTDGTGFRFASDCLCPPGTFRASTGACVACGDGALCRGFGAPPEAAPGYELALVSDAGVSIYSCFSERRRCPGGSAATCATGRTGIGCTECKPSMTEGPAGTCVPCKSSDGLPFWFAVCGAGVIIGLVYGRSRYEDTARQSHATLLMTASWSQMIGVAQVFGVVSRLSINWKEPFLQFIQVLEIMDFNMQLLRLGCVGNFGATGVYSSKIMVLPLALAFTSVVHVAVLAAQRGLRTGSRRREEVNTSPLISTNGVIFLTFFITVTTTILSPYQCIQHPNGVWTVQEYGTVICWKGGKHAIMIALGAMAFLMPTGFIVAVTYLLHRFPARMSAGDIQFLNTYSFLFFRIKPQYRWFVLLFLFRNLALAFMPAVPNATLQIILMQVVLFGTVLIAVGISPWRFPIVNRIDMVSSTGMMGVVFLAALCIPGADLTVAAQVSIFCATASLMTFPCMLVYILYRKCAAHKKPYTLFLSHHKAATGACARLVKMFLLERNSRSDVFLDSDNLSDLDSLFHAVANWTEALVAFCSKQFLTRAWCLGEVVAAHEHGLRVLPIHFPDFSPPDDSFIKGIGDLVDFAPLAKNGMGVAKAQAALRNFLSLRHLELAHPLTRNAIDDLAQNLLRQDMSPPSSPANRMRSAAVERRTEAAILSDSSHREASAAALVLTKLLTRTLMHTTALIPAPLEELQPCQREWVTACVVLCTSNCFSERGYLLGLLWARHQHLTLVFPVIAQESFLFPTPSFYEELERSVAQLCVGAHVDVKSGLLTKFVETVFKKIALPLTILGSSQTLEDQAKAIASRLQGQRTAGIAEDVQEHPIIERILSGEDFCQSELFAL